LNFNPATGVLKTVLPSLSAPPTVGVGTAQAIEGSTYWDNYYGAMFIYYVDGTSSQWVEVTTAYNAVTQLNFPSAPVSGQQYSAPNGVTYFWDSIRSVWAVVDTSVQPATLAEAAAGVISNKYMSPMTSVPKDAAGMTGAALISTGTSGQRPAGVTGMLRFNTDDDYMEVYDGSTSLWRKLAYLNEASPVGDLIPANGSVLPPAGVYENIIINAGVTGVVNGGSQLYAQGSVTINGVIQATGSGNPGGNGSGASQDDRGYVDYGAGTGRNQNTYGFTFGGYLGTGGASGRVQRAAGVTSLQAANGGTSGGSIIIKSQGPLNVGPSGQIYANGTDAVVGSTPSSGNDWGSSGASGGTGGLILLQSDMSLTLAAGSVLQVRAGNSTNGRRGGGFTGGVGGGGGSGGGYIVLSSPATSDGSSKDTSGGAAGSRVGSVASITLSGSQGAGYGGVGGGGGQPGIESQNGSPGQVLYNVYI
jgi:hypothetical protein